MISSEIFWYVAVAVMCKVSELNYTTNKRKNKTEQQQLSNKKKKREIIYWDIYPKGTTILAIVYTTGGIKNKKMIDAEVPIRPSAPILR